jgi:hypothetical protein
VSFAGTIAARTPFTYVVQSSVEVDMTRFEIDVFGIVIFISMAALGLFIWLPFLPAIGLVH